jgi:hypothetical protein
VLDGPGTAADSSDAYDAPTSPGPFSPTSRNSRAWPAAEGPAAAAAAAPGHGRMKEYRLHSSRITAIKVLHTAGVVFTARWVGVSMRGSVLAAGATSLAMGCCALLAAPHRPCQGQQCVQIRSSNIYMPCLLHSARFLMISAALNT